MRITVVGTGYVGTVTGACLAWLGHDVVGLDTDARRVAELGAGQLPFYEPDLPQLLSGAVSSGRLRFVTDAAEALAGADVVFICVGTPASDDGAPELRQVRSAVDTVGAHMPDDLVVVSKSTVPVGTADWIRERLSAIAPTSFAVVSNPEFLREGSAVTDFLHPDRVVLGGDGGAVDRLLDIYRPILEQSFAGGRLDGRPTLVVTDTRSAEMIKYASNAFLVTRVSWANEIANLCELLGADPRQVLPAVGADHRIGTAYLQPGLGWGGSCLPKDVAALIAMGDEGGYRSPVLRAVEEVNRAQREAVVHLLSRELGGLLGRRIAILGLAFKPGTDDVRQAPALDLIRQLVPAGATVAAYDPVVKELPEGVTGVVFAGDPYAAADRADAVVVATEWPEIAEIDLAALGRRMTGTLVIDGRECLDPAKAAEGGLRIVPVRVGSVPGNPHAEPPRI